MKTRPVARMTCGTLVLAGLLAAPVGAFAQPATPVVAASPTPPAASGAQPASAADAPAVPLSRRTAARIEARIVELHRELHITPAQEAKWEVFTTQMRLNAAHTDEILAHHRDPLHTTAVEDMENYAAMAETHAADMQKLLPAFQALYSSMSPEQQKQTDAVFHQQEERRMR